VRVLEEVGGFLADQEVRMRFAHSGKIRNQKLEVFGARGTHCY
jgi:hypothetical protein